MLVFMYPLEIMSNFLRLLSLTIRLWANLLAGHLLIEFMAGRSPCSSACSSWAGSRCRSGSRSIMFEAVLIAGLQAFIFAILTAIYLGGATPKPLKDR